MFFVVLSRFLFAVICSLVRSGFIPGGRLVFTHGDMNALLLRGNWMSVIRTFERDNFGLLIYCYVNLSVLILEMYRYLNLGSL